jgi:hypothetical protein
MPHVRRGLLFSWRLIAGGTLVRLALAALVLLISAGCAGAGGNPPASEADTWFEVTDEAVQTFYQDGVPHTDWAGGVTTTYQEGSSFFPLGIYYPELCRRQAWLAWEPFTGSWDADGDGENDWDGSYQLRIALADVPSSAGLPQRALVHDRAYTTTQALPAQLPAGEELHWTVLPNPWSSYPGEPIAEGDLNLDCPPPPDGDVDDPNVIETLKESGFNLALPFRRNHPQPFLNLMREAGIEGFKVVVDAGEGEGGAGFAEDLFASASAGGQGYSEDPDVYGWQVADEPLLRAAIDAGGDPCDPAVLQAALDRLERTYAQHKDATDQVIFHVEGAPRYFTENGACDPGPYWEASVRIGDAANHDNYVSDDESSLEDIAASMTRQTNAVGEAKPSWFTTRAYSYEDDGFPSPARNRASVYTAIVHGATGIWQFIWDSFMSRFTVDLRMVGVRPDIPESYDEAPGISADEELRTQGEALWDAIAELNHELAALEPALLSPTAPDGTYRVFVSDPASQVRTMLKQAPDGDDVLIAVNMNTVATDVRFDFDGALAEAEALFEDERSPDRRGDRSMSDRFGGIDDEDGSAVHVYRIRLE